MLKYMRAHERAGYGSVSKIALLATATALAIVIAGDAAAKPQPKKRDDAAASASAPIALPPRSSGGPVRFFTINQVLAKRDGRPAGDDSVRVAAVDPKDTATDAPNAARTKGAIGPEPFGLYTFRAPEGLLWVKWRGVESEMDAETKLIAACRAAPDDCKSTAAKRFLAIVAEAKGQTGQAQIGTINRAINGAIRYVSDMAQHGVADKWSSPLTSLGSGQGDCEDYAIAKYAALREAGIAVDDLRLVLVRDRVAGDHAVLAVRNAGRWLVLDNRHAILVDTSELPQFTPLFAIDHQGVKLFAAPYAQRPTHESEAEPATAAPAPSAPTAVISAPNLI
jgi:predicted transglutaminase-like cysteine proteinase